MEITLKGAVSQIEAFIIEMDDDFAARQAFVGDVVDRAPPDATITGKKTKYGRRSGKKKKEELEAKYDGTLADVEGKRAVLDGLKGGLGEELKGETRERSRMLREAIEDARGRLGEWEKQLDMCLHKP